jgi:hypothetical protein
MLGLFLIFSASFATPDFPSGTVFTNISALSRFNWHSLSNTPLESTVYDIQRIEIGASTILLTQSTGKVTIDRAAFVGPLAFSVTDHSPHFSISVIPGTAEITDFLLRVPPGTVITRDSSWVSYTGRPLRIDNSGTLISRGVKLTGGIRFSRPELVRDDDPTVTPESTATLNPTTPGESTNWTVIIVVIAAAALQIGRASCRERV